MGKVGAALAILASMVVALKTGEKAHLWLRESVYNASTTVDGVRCPAQTFQVRSSEQLGLWVVCPFK